MTQYRKPRYGDLASGKPQPSKGSAEEAAWIAAGEIDGLYSTLPGETIFEALEIIMKEMKPFLKDGE